MNSFRKGIPDILLFPAKLYEKITDGRLTLYAGIALVGAVDLLLPDATEALKGLFTGKPPATAIFNAAAALFMIVLLGVLDVAFVCVPLYDFFRFIKRKEEASAGSAEERAAMGKSGASLVKVMKVYIMSHFIIIPVTTIIYLLFLRNMGQNSPEWIQNLILPYFILIMVWSAAILTRGVNTLFRFNPIFRKLTFLIIFSWNYIFGMVFEYMIMPWLMHIFR